MDVVTWIPGITTSGIVLGILWLSRKLIEVRLTRSVQHEFDEKLETLRASFRSSEEQLKASLRAKEVEISALQTGALSALASRQAALDRRRLEAIDQLWSAVNAIAPARFLARNLAVLNYDVSAEHAKDNPKMRNFLETLGGGFDMRKADQSGASKARPFVTPMVWAVYSAIVAVTSHAVIRWVALSSGLGTKDFINHEAVKKLIVAVLPHYDSYLAKNDPSAFYYLFDDLDAKLLEEIGNMLAGREGDAQSLRQAAEIIKQASELRSAAESSKTDAA